MTFYLICFLVLTICFQFSSPLPDGVRFRRHADGLFTSELSKIKNDVAMRSYLRSLLISKRSISELNFPKDSDEYEARFEEACFNWLYQNFLIKSLGVMYSSKFDSSHHTENKETSLLCSMLAEDSPFYSGYGCFYERQETPELHVLIVCLSENDALKATQESYKLICRPLVHFIVKKKEYIPSDQLLNMTE